MKYIKYYFFAVCFFALSFTVSNCYANPDSSPFIVIIVNNAPSDLEITFDFDDVGYVRKHKLGMETQFSYYSDKLQREKEVKINVTTSEKSTEYTIGSPLGYRNVYTLNLQNNTLIDGITPLRYIRLVLVYILLTLLLEGIIFYGFGFRQKKSWILFVIINLFTQGLLHIWTDSPNLFDSFVHGYDGLIFVLISGEVFVFLFEMIAIAVFVKENSIKKRIIYALSANLFSLILGWFILIFIPV